jgi:SAM-dependent methyltransferase
MTTNRQAAARKWPKSFPPLTPQQEAIRNDFVKRWLEVFPDRYGLVERFNHEYPLRAWDTLAAPGGAPVRTLEIGAGLGSHLVHERLDRQEYHALELRENVLAVLKRRYPAVHATLGDIEQRTPFPDAFFDRVIVVHVLEHLCNLPAALDEIRRVLKPTGILSVVAPCEGGFAYSLARRISAQRMFEKEYGSSYRWFIEREHVNTYDEVLEELTGRFTLTHERRWPLPGLPIAVNLIVGLTLSLPVTTSRAKGSPDLNMVTNSSA